MIRRSTIILTTALLTTAASAANVAVVQGEALLSHGEGFEPVVGAADLAPGDIVVAKVGSSVKVTFSNGCTVFLGMGMVFNVPAEPPCGETTNALRTGTIGEVAPPAQDWTAVTQTTVAPAETQTSMMPYLLGAAAVGGIAAGALAFAGGGGSPPASP